MQNGLDFCDDSAELSEFEHGTTEHRQNGFHFLADGWDPEALANMTDRVTDSGMKGALVKIGYNETWGLRRFRQENRVAGGLRNVGVE